MGSCAGRAIVRGLERGRRGRTEYNSSVASSPSLRFLAIITFLWAAPMRLRRASPSLCFVLLLTDHVSHRGRGNSAPSFCP